MADATEFFNGLQTRIDTGEFNSANGSVFQFNIEGAGNWSIDLKDAQQVAEGTHETPDCTITITKENFETILVDSSQAMGMFFSGGFQVDGNPMLAMSLQTFLG